MDRTECAPLVGNKTPWLASGTAQERGFRRWWLCEDTAMGMVDAS